MSPSRPPEPRRCPGCRKPAVAQHSPFCSAVCRDRDLIAWLDERHILPGRPMESEDQDETS